MVPLGRRRRPGHCPAAQPLRAYLGGDASSLPGAPPTSRVDFVQVRVVNEEGGAGHDGHSVESARIARRSTVRWTGRIHEQLKPIEGSAQGRSIRLAPELLHVRHRGYVDQQVLRAKGERNVAIAQAQIDDLVAGRSDDPVGAGQAGYDLARSLLAAGRTQEAIEAAEVVREIATDTVFWSLATLLLAQILLDNEGFEDAGLFLADQLASDGRTSATILQLAARTGVGQDRPAA